MQVLLKSLFKAILRPLWWQRHIDQVFVGTVLAIPALDNKLSFDQHKTGIHKHPQQRLHITRKLGVLSVAPHLLLSLYKNTIQPILMYGSRFFYDMLTISNKNELAQDLTLLRK